MSGDASAIHTAVVLPGLDGTGFLLKEFAVALEPFFRVRTVRYPTHEPHDYGGLLELVRVQLPQEDYIVIGESFSGPLALCLAQEEPVGLKGIVLGASFARLDLPAKTVLSSLVGVVPPHFVPIRLLAPFLLGHWSTPELRDRLRQALSEVAPHVLAARARAALAVDLLRAGRAVRRPVLCLRARSDRLVPKSAAQELARLAPDMQVRDIVAPHFLFQVAPRECAGAICDFRNKIEGD